jgi:hypothetical protein
MQNRKIKLIWDFRGPAAAKTAAHHEKHLKEFIEIEKLNGNTAGHQHLNEMHSMAFMVIDEVQIPKLRDSLKPHRAEVHENQ